MFLREMKESGRKKCRSAPRSEILTVKVDDYQVMRPVISTSCSDYEHALWPYAHAQWPHAHARGHVTTVWLVSQKCNIIQNDILLFYHKLSCQNAAARVFGSDSR